MKRWLAVAVVAAMLAVPVAYADAWTQSGHDPARSDHVPDQGPTTNDTAFQVDLPGGYPSPLFVGQGPLVLDGEAYVPVRPYGPEDLGLTANGLARVDLATADVSMAVTLEDEVVRATAADGDHVYLVTNRQVHAYERPNFELAWSWQPPDPGSGPGGDSSDGEAEQGCATPAVRDGQLYLGCIVSLASGTTQGFVAALDTETGRADWIWNATDDPAEGSRESQIIFVLGLSVIDDQVLTMRISQASGVAYTEGFPCPACDTGGFAVKRNVSLLALDADEGTLDWSHGRSTTYATGEASGQPLTPPSETGFEDIPGQTWQPTGTPSAVYLKLGDHVKALNPAQGGQVIWAEPVGQEDTAGDDAGDPRGATLAGDRLFITSTTTLYRFDTSREAIDWTTLLPPERGEKFTRGELILAGDTLYVSTAQRYPDNQPDGTTLYGFNATSGDIQWQRYLPQRTWAANNDVDTQHYHSVADGALVAASTDGVLTVIGETEASLGAPDVDTDRYPEAGDEVTIDASDTEPGAFGEATRYMVDWGDGTTSGWQASPTFTHAYEDEGTYDARVFAGNDANQTASSPVTMNVGQEEPNWLSERFEPENQDMTFGVLGVAIALGGGFIGVARRKRKKSILQDELEALEEGFERTRDNPGECEAFLDTRKARAQSLLLDGDLDEEQFGVLERRIDELHGELRTSVLDSRFEFLPHGMVQSLKKMLADGRISTWEREAIADLLDREEALTEAQKETVRGQLDRWFAEDAGGGAA